MMDFYSDKKSTLTFSCISQPWRSCGGLFWWPTAAISCWGRPCSSVTQWPSHSRARHLHPRTRGLFRLQQKFSEFQRRKAQLFPMYVWKTIPDMKLGSSEWFLLQLALLPTNDQKWAKMSAFLARIEFKSTGMMDLGFVSFSSLLLFLSHTNHLVIDNVLDLSTTLHQSSVEISIITWMKSPNQFPPQSSFPYRGLTFRLQTYTTLVPVGNLQNMTLVSDHLLRNCTWYKIEFCLSNSQTKLIAVVKEYTYLNILCSSPSGW